ncbi:hypothetical protein VOLCADRAFT_100493 [Volvox carteri f. nagariensis]|uniref:Uncharacterized protein n=1 Tax=Volvox carteri f. nagariensis TaxID=3068 RepID=D8UKB7_VOLCA|nr:uncharacterized protein VOLCADRAFT_100493 [Volvox carteri f. nagariensis]EFJ39824.1 hypothetical protein VOLCADRAFT_100493 [Volvox carteri f. nagariensis]|eukprot:XP_002959096.1 hypothetical protein VOLCADRAFT_100493 [Volvox carteri f. nagariensis]
MNGLSLTRHGLPYSSKITNPAMAPVPKTRVGKERGANSPEAPRDEHEMDHVPTDAPVGVQTIRSPPRREDGADRDQSMYPIIILRCEVRIGEGPEKQKHIIQFDVPM